MTLPAHPPPLKDESMASWIFRLANANGTSSKSLLSSCIGERPWEKMDLDMLAESEISVLGEISKTKNQLLRRMALSDLKDDFILAGTVNRKTWLSSTFMIRYCPLCLQEDDVPYYRLLWRLHFLPVCMTHRILLHNNRRNRPLELKDALVSYPRNCARVLSFSSNIYRTIDEQEIPKTFEFPYSLKEFLGALMLFVLYFSRYLPREKEWKELRHLYYASPCGFRYLWRTKSYFICIVMEKALMVLERWSETEKFILQNQSDLKRLCYGFEEDVPKYVMGLIRNNHPNAKVGLVRDSKPLPSISQTQGNDLSRLY